ncbi:tetratricopeptide repeat protein [Hymenobacter sp. B81]|uniref:tetratricopeptide repeat protein n=1 Tax=Hymenobacter sp. B81 TaxID=3344878 RepID=UPI0037DC8BED
MSGVISGGELHRLEMLFDVRRLDLAEEVVTRLLIQHPQSAQLHRLLGRALYHQGKLPAAGQAVRTAIQLDPQHGYGFFLQGLIQADGGQATAAESSFREAIRLSPRAAGYWVALGYSCHAQQRPTEALDALNQALALAPANPEAWRYRYAVLVSLADYPAADQALRHWLRLSPTDARAQLAAGQTALRHHDYSAARQHLTEALRLEPGLQAAKPGLATALKRRFALQRWFDAGKQRMDALYLRGTEGHLGALLLVVVLSIVLAYLCVPLLLAYLGLYLRWRLDPQVRRLLSKQPRFSLNQCLLGTRRELMLALLLIALLGVSLVGMLLDHSWAYPLAAGLLLAVFAAAWVAARARP